MRRLSRGFYLAAALVSLAVAAPCAAWYVAGSHSVQQQADQLERLVRDRGHQIALGLAERLRGRLEAMADAESLRPFYYFQASFHDPTSTCECSSRSPSPLATGPSDPFIAGYFQIDSAHALSLPLEESGRSDARSALLQTELSAATTQCLNAVDLTDPRHSFGPSPWKQSGDGGPLVDRLVDDPQLHVDPFQWHGIDLPSGPALIALRRVDGSSQRLVQGFVLARDAVRAWMDAAEWKAELRPVIAEAAPASEVSASVPLECAQWEVAVRVDGGLRDARRQSTALRKSFRRNFAAGTAAAVVSALALLSVLAWRERNERQRVAFAAAAAHELRTPIAGLRLYSEMLNDPQLPDQRRQDYAHRIAGESARLGRVVANVLSYTGLERGQMHVDARRIDVSAEIERMLPTLRDSLAATDARLVTVDTWPQVHAIADPDALEQIVRNLVDNAEKYTRECGDRRIHLEVLESDEGPCVQVIDHGPGISAELGEDVFHAFHRGNHSAAGLGLGLTLGQALANAQGGRLEYTTASGGGACFTLHLPGA